jgi:hypothetical protein
MIAADRDAAARRRVDEQDGWRLSGSYRVEEVQLEADNVIGSERRREDYVEDRHTGIIAGAVANRRRPVPGFILGFVDLKPFVTDDASNLT